MKDIKLKDIQTLEKTSKGYSYRIRVLGGNDIVGSEIPTEEEVIIAVESQLMRLNKAMLKK